MTNKELREALSNFPDDAQVEIWDEKEDMNGCSFGWYRVNCVQGDVPLGRTEEVIMLKHLYKNEIPHPEIVKNSRNKLYIIGSNGDIYTNLK